MGISEYRATGGNKALLNEYHRKKDSAAVWYVNFDKYDDQKFGFDLLTKYDFASFVGDETAKIMSLNKPLVEPSLKCVKELMLKGVSDDNIEEGYLNCFVEAILFVLKTGNKHIVLPNLTDAEKTKLSKVFDRFYVGQYIEGSFSNYLKQ